jgi:FlaA1/EpsC-like NDP-sugar epimerase
VKSAENPDGQIEVTVIGLRPGEKLHEELLIQPGMLTTPHEKILRVQERGLTSIEMTSALRDLRNAVAVGNAAAARNVLESYVEGYGTSDASRNRRERIGS